MLNNGSHHSALTLDAQTKSPIAAKRCPYEKISLYRLLGWIFEIDFEQREFLELKSKLMEFQIFLARVYVSFLYSRLFVNY